jgi:phosphohistidine phosphatase
MRRAMQDLGLTPDLVLVSPAKRTMETLEALEPWDETPLVEPVEALYLAPETQLLATLREVAETVRSVLLIGHNPGMHDLALSLAGERSASGAMRGLTKGFPTGTLAEFIQPGPWREAGPGTARLVRYLTPKALEEAAR